MNTTEKKISGYTLWELQGVSLENIGTNPEQNIHVCWKMLLWRWHQSKSMPFHVFTKSLLIKLLPFLKGEDSPEKDFAKQMLKKMVKISETKLNELADKIPRDLEKDLLDVHSILMNESIKLMNRKFVEPISPGAA